VPMAAEAPGSLQEGLPASRFARSACQDSGEARGRGAVGASAASGRVKTQGPGAVKPGGFAGGGSRVRAEDPGPTQSQASALAVHELKRLPKLRSRRGSDLSEEEFRSNYIDSLRVSDSNPAASHDRQGSVLNQLTPLPPKINMDPRLASPAPNIPPPSANEGVNPVNPSGYGYPFAAAHYFTQNPELQLPIVTDGVPFCGSRPLTVSNEDEIHVLSKALTAVAEDTGNVTRSRHNKSQEEEQRLSPEEIDKIIASEAVDLPRKSSELLYSEPFRDHIKSAASPGGKSGAHQSHRSHGSHSSLRSDCSHVQDAKRKRKLRRAHEVAVAHVNGVEEEWPDPHKYNASTEFCQSLNNPMRRFAIRCIEWPMWDTCVLFLIFINTIQLSLYDPMVRGNKVL
jgi:hypothetical protein